MDGTPVFLQDIWPTRAEIQVVEQKYVIPAMFKEVYDKIEKGSTNWANLVAPDGKLYPWDPSSTYIKHPPYFDNIQKVNYILRYIYIYIYFIFNFIFFHKFFMCLTNNLIIISIIIRNYQK